MILNSGGGREDEGGAYIKPGVAGTPREGAVYAVAGSSGKITNAPLNHPAMYISLLEFGSMVLDVSGNRLEAKFLDETGTVRDHFTIIKGDDTFAPTVVSAESTDETEVTVHYSEPMDQVSTAVTNHYDINGLTVSQATLQSDQRTLVLTTTPMTPGMTHTLTVNDVEDLASNPIVANTLETFTVTSPIVTLSFQEGVAPSSSYTGARDASLAADQPDSNTGQDTVLLVDGDDPPGTGLDKSALMYWDITQIPDAVSVQSVSIEIEVSNPSQTLYSFYQMNRDWQETEVTWNQYANGSPWATPGALGVADREITALGATVGSALGVQAFALNTAGVALVQSWIDGTAPNYGFILGDVQSNDGLDFWSSDALSPTVRPRLIIEYRLPAPSDSDGDGVPDATDNCILVANGLNDTVTAGPSQNDTDMDGYGNWCDADLDNSDFVNFGDLAAFKAAFGTTDADADLDGSGFVNFGDLARFKALFGQPPGPSGLVP
jgi:hypothetical protein